LKRVPPQLLQALLQSHQKLLDVDQVAEVKQGAVVDLNIHNSRSKQPLLKRKKKLAFVLKSYV